MKRSVSQNRKLARSDTIAGTASALGIAITVLAVFTSNALSRFPIIIVVIAGLAVGFSFFLALGVSYFGQQRLKIYTSGLILIVVDSSFR